MTVGPGKVGVSKHEETTAPMVDLLAAWSLPIYHSIVTHVLDTIQDSQKGTCRHFPGSKVGPDRQ